MALPVSAAHALQNLNKIISDLGILVNSKSSEANWKESYWRLVQTKVPAPLNLIPIGLHFNHPIVRSSISFNRSEKPQTDQIFDERYLKAAYFDARRLIESVFPDFAEMLDILGISVHVVSHAPGAAQSGSSFTMPGFFFVSVSSDTCPEHVAELIVHELTHNWLFFEEMANGLFFSEVFSLDSSIRVASPFKNERRRFDQSFHALAVAIVTSEFRRSANMPDLLTKVPIDEVVEDLEREIHVRNESGVKILIGRGESLFKQLVAFHSASPS